MTKESATIREAVAAQVLGEVDDLVLRVENIARALAEVEVNKATSAAALLDAADKFRLAVTHFSEAATAQVRESVEAHAHKTVSETTGKIEEAMLGAARQAWRSITMDAAESLTKRLHALVERIKPIPIWQRIGELAIGGFVGALVVVLALLATGKM